MAKTNHNRKQDPGSSAARRPGASAARDAKRTTNAKAPARPAAATAAATADEQPSSGRAVRTTGRRRTPRRFETDGQAGGAVASPLPAGAVEAIEATAARPGRLAELASLVSAGRAHPVASAVVTAATAWLAYEGVRRELPQAAVEASQKGLSAAGAGARRAARLAREESSEVAGTLRRGATALGAGARRGVKAGQDAAADLWENHPVAAGISLLAIGIAIGMALPATSIERSVAAGRSSRLLAMAATAGGDLLNRGRRMASEAVREGAAAAAEEADRVGLTPDRIVRKVKRIASRVGETVARVGEGD